MALQLIDSALPKTIIADINRILGDGGEAQDYLASSPLQAVIDEYNATKTTDDSEVVDPPTFTSVTAAEPTTIDTTGKLDAASATPTTASLTGFAGLIDETLMSSAIFVDLVAGTLKDGFTGAAITDPGLASDDPAQIIYEADEDRQDATVAAVESLYGASQGLLGIDLNGNGYIDSEKELFGFSDGTFIGTTSTGVDTTATAGFSVVDMTTGFTTADTVDFTVNSVNFQAISADGTLDTLIAEIATASGGAATAVRVDATNTLDPTGTFIRITATNTGQDVTAVTFTDVDGGLGPFGGTDTATAAGFGVIDMSTGFNAADTVAFDVNGTRYTATSSDGNLDTLVTEIGTASGGTATAVRVDSNNNIDAAGTFIRITSNTLGQDAGTITFTDVDGSTAGTFGSINLTPYFDPDGATYSGSAFTGTNYDSDFFSGDYATEFAKAAGDTTQEQFFLDNLMILTADGQSTNVNQSYADLLLGQAVTAETQFVAGTDSANTYQIKINVDIYA